MTTLPSCQGRAGRPRPAGPDRPAAGCSYLRWRRPSDGPTRPGCCAPPARLSARAGSAAPGDESNFRYGYCTNLCFYKAGIKSILNLSKK